MGGRDLWDSRTVAREAGLSVQTVITYTSRSRRRLKAGQELRPGDLPLPIHHGRRVWWIPAEIREWIAARQPLTRGEWEHVPPERVCVGDALDLPGEGLRWVQIVRRGRMPRTVDVRVGAHPGAVTGTWRILRGSVTRLTK